MKSKSLSNTDSLDRNCDKRAEIACREDGSAFAKLQLSKVDLIRLDSIHYAGCLQGKNWWSVKVTVLCDVPPCSLVDMSVSLYQVAACLKQYTWSYATRQINITFNMLICLILRQTQVEWSGPELRTRIVRVSELKWISTYDKYCLSGLIGVNWSGWVREPHFVWVGWSGSVRRTHIVWVGWLEWIQVDQFMSHIWSEWVVWSGLEWIEVDKYMELVLSEWVHWIGSVPRTRNVWVGWLKVIEVDLSGSVRRTRIVWVGSLKWIEVDQYVRHVLSFTCEMLYKVKEASNPKCSTPTSQSFAVYLTFHCFHTLQ
jgi:hypothetical protein